MSVCVRACVCVSTPKAITVHVVSFDGQNFDGFHSFKVNYKSFSTKN